MDTLLYARALMGVSLGFHILYAALGIGLPLMIMIAEGLALVRGQEIYHEMARRWIRPAGVLFAIGAVSGTVLSFELGFLWPGFMSFAGGVIGLPFTMEGFAFFTEAIFLAIYLYGEGRLSRRALFLSTIPMNLSAAASAVFVISANAWMNTPAGFSLEGGRVAAVQPLAAMANPAWLHQALHGTLASYVATAFAVAGLYAAARLRGREGEHIRRGLGLALVVAALFLPLMPLTGDYAARVVARTQPAKFAAMEGIFQTTAGAPMHIGGWPDLEAGRMRYGLEIPKLLSLITFWDPDAVVTGLHAFPADRRPDPRLVHTFFQAMVGSFFVMAFPLAWAGWLRHRRRLTAPPRGFLWAVLGASPFGFLALESGWLVTEFGRQPWLAAGYMRLAEGVTPRAGIEWVFLVFLAVYVALTVGLLRLLLSGGRPRTGAPSGAGPAHD
ncbi:MAG: cytochrome ubiquinol oxidase subunit I [Candidatus Methylomirabilales bacterium]